MEGRAWLFSFRKMQWHDAGIIIPYTHTHPPKSNSVNFGVQATKGYFYNINKWSHMLLTVKQRALNNKENSRLVDDY